MTWPAEPVAWWETRENVHEFYRPRRFRPSPVLDLDWENIPEEREEEFEAVLDVLTSRPDEDEEEPEEIGPRTEYRRYWAAQLWCDGRAVATATSVRFHERADVVTFIRWLAVHLGQIPRVGGGPPRPAEERIELFEEQFAPPRWEPTDPTECALYVTREDPPAVTLLQGDHELLSSIALKPREVADFLVWLDGSIAEISIDPEDAQQPRPDEGPNLDSSLG